ncbi:MAG: carbon-nitrogen hydrolase family protein [Armatimonadota bacterium]
MARAVRIATIAFRGDGSTPDEKRANALRMVEDAAALFPDIVCLPEVFTALGYPCERWLEVAEPVPGPTTDAVSALARKHQMWVICPIVERDNGRLHNTAVVIDRTGAVAGRYRKIHPTIDEIENGMVPGQTPEVFRTDFGTIGCAICFDLNFRDVIEGLSSRGAEVVFFPSMYCGGLQMRIWAHDFGVFMASAHSGGRSAIVDPLGRILRQSSEYEPVIYSDINLDGVVLHIDYNHQHWPAIRKKYGAGVEIDVSCDEAKFRLVSHLEAVTARQVIQEFGLETLPDYFARAEAERRCALSKR